MEKRNIKQKEVEELYIKENKKHCTLVLATGFGKSKVALSIIEKLNPSYVLIVVNSQDLRDFSWKEEFIKFGYEQSFNTNVRIETYQTVYKWTKEEVNLPEGTFIIADEVDFAADVPEYSKFFYEFAEYKILGLTGFITDKKRLWFDTNLPVIYEYTIASAQNQNILNKMHFVFVKYELFKHNTLEVSYTKNGEFKKFMTSENNSYEFAQNKFRKFVIAKKVLESKVNSGDVSYVDYEKESAKLQYLIDNSIRERNNILLNSQTSASIAKQLIKESSENQKIIVFSVLTDHSSTICEHTYNGTNSKAINSEIFTKFNNGEIRVLGVCSKLNRGINIDSLNTAIFETFYGSDTQATQRLGRLARLNPKDTSLIYVLLPYYRARVEQKDNEIKYELKETQQVQWARNMLKTTSVTSYEIIDYTYESR